MNAERGPRNAETGRASAKALVCFALKEEANTFQKLAAEREDIRVLLTGIGRKNAESAVAASLVGSQPQIVLTCGFAGGLDPRLAIGDVVFTTDNANLRAKLNEAGARRATFHCATRVAVTVAEKAELRRTTGAEAVEMESEAIQAICRERGIPCATVRAISDTANDDLPVDFNQLAKPDLNLSYSKLASALARSPGKIPALLRLQKNCHLAGERLAAVLAKVLEHG